MSGHIGTDTNLPSHYAMVGDICRTLMSWSPAVFVGFNPIRFDEEMLRHALFKCLYPAYLTSNHRNCRADALSLVMAADAASPAQLVVPLSEEGRRTFRLQHLAATNDVAHEGCCLQGADGYLNYIHIGFKRAVHRLTTLMGREPSSGAILLQRPLFDPSAPESRPSEDGPHPDMAKA